MDRDETLDYLVEFLSDLPLADWGIPKERIPELAQLLANELFPVTFREAED